MSFTSLMNTEFGNSNNSSISSLMPMWLFTNSGSWTCPEDGLYRLICIGKGGDGGNGKGYAYYVDSWKADTLYGYDGCGGAGGGVAIGEQQLTFGSVLTITVNDSYSSINDTALKATAGENGYDAVVSNTIISISGSIPNGGTASGTWLKYGFNGQKPNTVNITRHDATLYVGDVYRGGDVGIVILSPAINKTSGVGAFQSSCTDGSCSGAYFYGIGTAPSTNYSIFENLPSNYKNDAIPGGGMAGAGGASGSLCFHSSYSSKSGSIYSYSFSGKGGKGGTGAVLIQRIG